MSTDTKPHARREIVYPDSDGKPLSDNTLQFRWIMTIQGGLDTLFRDDPNVFVAGDLLWYPVEGDNKTRQAPDTMVAFGRPKGDRGSYKQWVEGGVAPQVVFEVLSPKNRRPEMDRKRAWYFRFGVEEYYEFDPDRIKLRGWIKQGDDIREILPMSGHISPRLGVRFELTDDLTIYGPDGQPLLSYTEVARERDENRRDARQFQEQAEAERQRAEAERQRAEAERQRAEAERQRADRLAARLRELGLDLEE
jgi:Uma2 family endonuclease